MDVKSSKLRILYQLKSQKHYKVFLELCIEGDVQCRFDSELIDFHYRFAGDK